VWKEFFIADCLLLEYLYNKYGVSVILKRNISVLQKIMLRKMYCMSCCFHIDVRTQKGAGTGSKCMFFICQVISGGQFGLHVYMFYYRSFKFSFCFKGCTRNGSSCYR